MVYVVGECLRGVVYLGFILGASVGFRGVMLKGEVLDFCFFVVYFEGLFSFGVYCIAGDKVEGCMRFWFLFLLKVLVISLNFLKD